MYKIIIVLIATIIIVILLIKRFVYFRPEYGFRKPEENYEDIYQSGLHAWYKKGTSGKVILFCHGNGGNISYCQDKIHQLLQMGHSVLAFDYKGYGQSIGVPSEQSCYDGAEVYYNYLQRQGYMKENIIPYGESLGGVVAIYLARKFQLPKVILQSSIVSIKSIIKYRLNTFLGSLLGKIFYEFDTEYFLQGYKGTILFLHSKTDEIIPYNTTVNIREKLNKNYSYNITSIDINGTHNYPSIPWETVRKFI
tara:strand:- start:139 stop:891 length:753 start_codon:yes stop_codon:yes gene_type:complete